MKLFIKSLILFGSFFVISTVFMILTTSIINIFITDFTIPTSRTVLVIGDSHTECAINDNILENVYNFSQSGSGYFYSYLKTKKILESNSHIKTVILDYSYQDLKKSKDIWFKGSKEIRFKMPNHFFLFSFDDFTSLLMANPYEMIINLPRVISINIYFLFSNNNINRLGGYNHLVRNKLQEDKVRYVKRKKNALGVLSEYQKMYLLKIYNLTRERNIELILLTTPIHPFLNKQLSEYKKEFNSFTTNQLPTANKINHAGLTIPEYGFGDLEHLNYKGALIYSKYLKKNMF